jgi:hypothetical protein
LTFEQLARTFRQLNNYTPRNEPTPELFEISGQLAVGVLAAATLVLICFLGLAQWKIALGVVGGAVLFSFAMNGIASGLVGAFCGAARVTGRSLGCIVRAFRN